MKIKVEQLSDWLQQQQQKLLANPNVQQAVNWFTSLSSRDQLIVKAVSGVVLVSLVFVSFYVPLLDSKKAAQSQLERNVTTYNLIASNAGRFGSIRQANQNDSILSATTSVAQQQGINLNRYEQDGVNLRVWLDKTSFDDAITWFEVLESQRGISVSQISIDKTDRTGRVDIRATLIR